MPNGYSLPYGDIYMANTPTTDRMSMLLYADQKQRELSRQKQMAQMDDEFRKNVSNIRDADVGEFTNKYQDWKQSRQDLMKMKPSDQQAFTQAQMASQRKLAELYQLANASKMKKQEEEDRGKAIMNKPNLFDDNAATYLTLSRQTPLGKLSNYQYIDPKTGQPQNLDLNDPNTYAFKGVDFDLSKALKDAKGIPRQTYTAEEPVPGGLQIKQTPYYFGNSPLDYKNAILGSLYTRNGGQFAERQFDDLDPNNVADVNKKFQEIPKEKWQQMTGSDKPQDLTIKDTDSKAEKYSKHLAQLYAINNAPEIRTSQYRTDEAEKQRREFAQQRTMEGIRAAHAKDLAAFRKSLGGDGDGGDGDNVWVDKYLDGITSKSTQTATYTPQGGQPIKENIVPLDPALKKALTVQVEGKPLEPSEFHYNPTTDTYRPVYYRTDENYQPIVKNGHQLVIPEVSKPLTRDQVKLALGVKTTSPTQRSKEMLTGGSGVTELSGKVDPSTLVKGKKYKVNGQVRVWDGQKLIK